MLLFVGLFTTSKRGIAVANKAEELRRRTPIVDKTETSLDFTILGLREEDIEAVKKEIQKCCQQESADIQVHGEEYSSIIKFLDQYQVSCTG